MGFLSPSPPQQAAPPPPPPLPPAANPPTYASSAIQATGAAARKRAAEGAGFEGSLFTGPQGADAGPTAKQRLGAGSIGGVMAQALKDKLGT